VNVRHGRGEDFDPGIGSRVALPGYTALRGIDVDRAGALVLARDDSTGARVVIRVLSPALVADSRGMHRLSSESERVRVLRHPNLVSLFGFDQRAGATVGEWVDGVSMRELIAASGALATEAAFVVFDDTLAALEALHAVSVLHRDVHPQIVIVDGDGLAKIRDAGVGTPPLHVGWRGGTPQQMAPELWAGAPHSVATDLYAATAVFHEALSGRPPFLSTDLHALRTQHQRAAIPEEAVLPEARALVLEGLAKDPAERPATASQFRADVGNAGMPLFGAGWEQRGRKWLAEQASGRISDAAAPESSPPPPILEGELDDAPTSDGERSRGWQRTRVVAAVAAAALLVVVVLAITVSALTRSTDQNSLSPGPVPVFTATPSPTAGTTTSPTPTPTSTPTPTVVPTQATSFPTPPSAPVIGPVSSPSPSPRHTPCSPLPTPCPTR